VDFGASCYFVWFVDHVLGIGDPQNHTKPSASRRLKLANTHGVAAESCQDFLRGGVNRSNQFDF